MVFIIFAIPSGFIAGRFGRRRTIITGLIAFSVLLVIAYFVPNYAVIAAMMALGGIAWAQFQHDLFRCAVFLRAGDSVYARCDTG